MYPFLQSRYWVFDLDGTLTRPVHDFEYIRRELGMESGADILATIESRDAATRFRLHQKLDHLEMFYARQAAPAKGVIDLLAQLTRSGCRLGIVTRNKKDFAISSLQAIKAWEFFDETVIIGRDEAAPKPHPQGIGLLLKQWQAAGEEAVMVGDFRYDLEVGRAVGAATIHVDDRLERSWPELTDLKVESLQELCALIG
ncbi:MAG: HAD family hydrolase [Amphritea sp.]